MKIKSDQKALEFRETLDWSEAMAWDPSKTLVDQAMPHNTNTTKRAQNVLQAVFWGFFWHYVA